MSVWGQYIISGRLIININPRQHCLTSDHGIAIFALVYSLLLESKKWSIECIGTGRNALGSLKL